MENTIPDTFFPEEIILILLRLPVKSLLRFKSVCKLWLSIISTPAFIKTHHSMSTKDPHLILAEAEDNAYARELKFSTCSLYNLQNDLLTETMFDESVTETIEGIINRVVGYCNGLVCLVQISDHQHHVVFWNPSTRKSRRLPQIMLPAAYVDPSYGFCYDECNDDFKVFAIYDDTCADEFYNKVSVYSSKSDSWRVINIGDLPFQTVFDGGVFANRAIYWKVYDGGDYSIISFDIKTEMYRQVLQPKYQEEIPHWTLGNFDNSLSVLYDLDTHVDLWVMIKECGPEESWTKLVTIQSYQTLVTYFSHLRPICIFENGVIMLNYYNKLVLYNSKDDTWENLLGLGYIDGLYVYTYVESLVSP